MQKSEPTTLLSRHYDLSITKSLWKAVDRYWCQAIKDPFWLWIDMSLKVAKWILGLGFQKGTERITTLHSVVDRLGENWKREMDSRLGVLGCVGARDFAESVSLWHLFPSSSGKEQGQSQDVPYDGFQTMQRRFMTTGQLHAPLDCYPAGGYRTFMYGLFTSLRIADTALSALAVIGYTLANVVLGSLSLAAIPFVAGFEFLYAQFNPVESDPATQCDDTGLEENTQILDEIKRHWTTAQTLLDVPSSAQETVDAGLKRTASPLEIVMAHVTVCQLIFTATTQKGSANRLSEGMESLGDLDVLLISPSYLKMWDRKRSAL